jgi:hypothetical protein
MLVVTVWDDFDMLNWASDGKYLSEHILSYARAQVANVEMGAPRSFGWATHAYRIHDLRERRRKEII